MVFLPTIYLFLLDNQIKVMMQLFYKQCFLVPLNPSQILQQEMVSVI